MGNAKLLGVNFNEDVNVIFIYEKRCDSHKLVNIRSCMEADQIGIFNVRFLWRKVD